MIELIAVYDPPILGSPLVPAGERWLPRHERNLELRAPDGRRLGTGLQTCTRLPTDLHACIATYPPIYILAFK